ncbi:hypothetical protein [Klebsiella aerogenes]|uniref:hypothetical protein n=1 Tax=Klebsiella aerogenes TaxID=548 RepID=UPI002FF4F1C6
MIRLLAILSRINDSAPPLTAAGRQITLEINFGEHCQCPSLTPMQQILVDKLARRGTSARDKRHPSKKG